MVLVGGITCCLSAAALYCLGRRSGRDADILKSVNQLEDLAGSFDVASVVPDLAISVSREDTVIRLDVLTRLTSHKYSGRDGIFYSPTKRKIFTYESSYERKGDLNGNVAGAVLSLGQELLEYSDVFTPFAYATGSRRGTCMVLKVGNEAYEKSRLLSVVDYIRTLKMLGVKRIERVLPTGAPFIIVGEAVKVDTRPARIQLPEKGPFYVSRETIDHVTTNLEKWSRIYNYASMGFTVFAVCLLAKNAFLWFMKRRRYFEKRKRILDAAAKRAAEDAGDYNGRTTCVVCFEQEYNSVFIPCGHMCCCMACSSRLKKCPLCRTRIDEAVRHIRTN